MRRIPPLPRPAHCLAAALLSAVPAAALPADFERAPWVAGLVSPLAMRFSPDGRLFVLEQSGRVRVIKEGKLLPVPFATLPVWSSHRETLVGIAFDPDFATNRYVYLHYSEGSSRQNRISRLTAGRVNPDVAETGSETAMLTGIGNPGNGFIGGALFFGKDRMLYAATAHFGAQDLGNLGGKVLRINPAGYPNVVPPDNPFVGKAGARPEVWAYGFREPFTGAADTVTGDIVINDVGDTRAEEVNLIVKGGNYGYEAGCEGKCGKTGMVDPWIAYDRGTGTCITGGAFYHGPAFPPEYRGSYFYADWGAAWIKRRGADGRISDFDAKGKVIQLDAGPDGALYLLRIEGESVPWSGVVERVRYLKAVPVAESGSGPAAALAVEASGKSVRFGWRGAPLGRAKLRIYTPEGALLFSISRSMPREGLVWQPTGDAAGPRVLLYSFEASTVAGSSVRRQGAFLSAR